MVECNLLQSDCLREDNCVEEDEEAPCTNKDIASHHQVASSMGDESTIEDLLLEDHKEL